MLLLWKQFRPSLTPRIVCQLSFTYRVAERVKGRKGHVSERRAGCIFVALLMKKALFSMVPAGILRGILWEDILETQGSTNSGGLRPLASFLKVTGRIVLRQHTLARPVSPGVRRLPQLPEWRRPAGASRGGWRPSASSAAL